MGSGVGHVEQEWLVVFLVFIQPLQRAISEGVGVIELRILRDVIWVFRHTLLVERPTIPGDLVSRNRLAWSRIRSRIEMVFAAPDHSIVTVKPARHRIEFGVLLARPEGVVTSWLQHLSQSRGISKIRIRPLVITTCQQSSARGKTLRGVIHLGKLHPARGEPVDVRRVDLPAVATNIRISHVIRQDDEDVGFGLGLCWFSGMDHG